MAKRNHQAGNAWGIDLQQTEAQANSFISKCLWIGVGIFLVVWLLTMLGVFIVDRAVMSMVFVGSAILMLAPSFLCWRFSADRPWMKYVILACAVLTVTVTNTILTYHAVLLYVLPLTYAAQYSRRSIVYYVYGLTVASVFVSTILGYYFGICDANVLFSSNHGTAYYMQLLSSGGAMAVNPNPLRTLSLLFVLPRCIVLAAFVPVIIHVSDNIARNSADMARLRYIGETDKATRFYNRNKYLELVENYYPGVERVGAIFWDINNLKHINDSFGHAYGDSLITAVANCIYELQSESRKVFRLGGDEFAMIVENANEAGVQALLNQWRLLIARKQAESSLPLSVAVGSALGVGANVARVLEQADASMYLDKQRIKRGEA